METSDSSLNTGSTPAPETPLLLVELRKTARWMKFLSILGFVFVGLAAQLPGLDLFLQSYSFFLDCFFIFR
jgi:hypothetical protein